MENIQLYRNGDVGIEPIPETVPDESFTLPTGYFESNGYRYGCFISMDGSVSALSFLGNQKKEGEGKRENIAGIKIFPYETEELALHYSFVHVINDGEESSSSLIISSLQRCKPPVGNQLKERINMTAETMMFAIEKRLNDPNIILDQRIESLLRKASTGLRELICT